MSFIQQASRALPFHGGTAASSPFQTRSGDPPSAPEASGKAGTLVLAPECNIPEPPTILPTQDSWQHRREQGLQDVGVVMGGGWGRGRTLPPTRVWGLRGCLFPTLIKTCRFTSTGQRTGGQGVVGESDLLCDSGQDPCLLWSRTQEHLKHLRRCLIQSV